MIILAPIEDFHESSGILYQLLSERTPEQSISHKEMPNRDDHDYFVANHPYLCWYLIFSSDSGEVVGSIYLTKEREIGISIFKDHHRKGYATKAIRMLMKKHPGRFLANINPKNNASIGLFTSVFGAKHIQNTYEFET